MSTPDDRESTWPPDRFELPEVPSDYLMGELILRKVFQRLGPSTIPAQPLHFGFVRLVDKATVVYALAREGFQEYLASKPRRNSQFFVAIGHLETCVGTMARCLRYLEALRRDKDAPQISRQLGILKNGGNRLTTMRDGVEHTHEHIVNGSLKPTDSVILKPSAEAITLKATEIRYAELAAWLHELRQVAIDLNRFDAKEPPATRAGSSPGGT